LQGIDIENFAIIAPFIDVVKICSAFPMLMAEECLKKKIKFYHDFGVLVSTGSTITEFAILENSLDRLVKEAVKVGFDIIEAGENSIDLSVEQKRKISDTI
jgi:phosphosulfolactate synthase